MTEEALEHNTPENVDALFSDLNYVIKYLSCGRLGWYGTVIDLFVEKSKIDLVGKRIADAGCATGNALRYIYDKHSPGELFGFDYSAEALKWARLLLPEATFAVRDLEDPIEMKFDLVLCFQTLEHLRYPKLVLDNLLDTLVDGGMLFLTVPDGATDGWYGHISKWAIQEFEGFTGAQHIWRLDDVILAVVVKDSA